MSAISDHDLTVLVEAAASGAVNSAAAHRGGMDWAAMDAGAKNAIREHALPFIYHGARALDELGYSKPREFIDPAELDELATGTVVVDRQGEVYEKGDVAFGAFHWFGIGTGTPYRQDTIELPATIVREPKP